MQKAEAKNRIQKLRQQIEELRYRYHVLDDPTVTDEVYDSLTRELKVLEKEFPEFVDLESSINRVGGKPLEKFVKVRHAVRMLSLSDAFSPMEMQDWEDRLRRLEPAGQWQFMCELKFDGLSREPPAATVLLGKTLPRI
jgi:DNA ligase (NAD+)